MREKEMVTKRRRGKDSPSSRNRLQSFPPDLLRFQESVRRIRNTYIYTCVDGARTVFIHLTHLSHPGMYARRRRRRRRCVLRRARLKDEAALSRDYDNFLRVARRTAVGSRQNVPRFRFLRANCFGAPNFWGIRLPVARDDNVGNRRFSAR